MTRLHVAWAEPAAPESAERLLTATELDRLRSFRRQADRDRFRGAHVLARLVAAEAMGVAPDAVALRQTCTTCGGPHGRPSIAAPDAPHISWSHAGERVLVAVTHLGPVGVDVESVAAVGTARVDRLALAPDEFDRLPPDGPGAAGMTPDRWRAVSWARKESLLKATGDGLSVRMTDLVVAPSDEPARLVSWPGRDPGTVRMADLDLGPEYAACLAVRTSAELPPVVPVEVDLTA